VQERLQEDSRLRDVLSEIERLTKLGEEGRLDDQGKQILTQLTDYAEGEVRGRGMSEEEFDQYVQETPWWQDVGRRVWDYLKEGPERAQRTAQQAAEYGERQLRTAMKIPAVAAAAPLAAMQAPSAAIRPLAERFAEHWMEPARRHLREAGLSEAEIEAMLKEPIATRAGLTGFAADAGLWTVAPPLLRGVAARVVRKLAEMKVVKDVEVMAKGKPWLRAPVFRPPEAKKTLPEVKGWQLGDSNVVLKPDGTVAVGKAVSGASEGNKRVVVGYRYIRSRPEGEISAGTFYYVETPSWCDPRWYKATELEFKNLLEIPQKEVEPFEGAPTEYLWYKWFKGRDYVKEAEKRFSKPFSEMDGEELMHVDQMVAREAVARGYDGIKYGEMEIQDLRGLTHDAPMEVLKVVKQRDGRPPVYNTDLEALRAIAKTPVQKSVYDKFRLSRIDFSIETAPRMFERIHPIARELFCDPMVMTNAGWRREMKALVEWVDGEGKRLGLRSKSWKRIGAYAIAKQPGGLETLKVMRVKEIPGVDTELAESEKWMYEAMRAKLKEFYDRVNEARVLNGKEPFEEVEDYFTFFRTVVRGAEQGVSPITTPTEKFFRLASPRFVHETTRKRSIEPLELRADRIFKMYSERALQYIHTAPAHARARELLGTIPIKDETGKVVERFSLQESNPHAYRLISDWLNRQVGAGTVSTGPLDRALLTLNRNITFSILSASFRSALIQPTAILHAAVEIGPKYTSRGIAEVLLDAARPANARATRYALDHSNVLIGREFDTALHDLTSNLGFITKRMAAARSPAIRAAGTTVGRARLQIGRAGIAPLQYLDMLTAKAVWLGAHAHAVEELGLSGKAAFRFADDVVIRTQASAARTDIAPIQAHALGRALTLFQTFVINQWGFITKDVLGVGKVGMSMRTRVNKLATLVVGATLLNTFYEDILGIPSPFPTPFNALDRALDEGEPWEVAVWRAVKEVSEVVPGPGGAVRFGSSPFGAVGELAGAVTSKVAGWPPTRATWPEITGKAMGVPGVGQAKKVVSGAKAGATPWQMVVGRTEPLPQKPATSLAELKRRVLQKQR